MQGTLRKLFGSQDENLSLQLSLSIPQLSTSYPPSITSQPPTSTPGAFDVDNTTTIVVSIVSSVTPVTVASASPTIAPSAAPASLTIAPIVSAPTTSSPSLVSNSTPSTSSDLISNEVRNSAVIGAMSSSGPTRPEIAMISVLAIAAAAVVVAFIARKLHTPSQMSFNESLEDDSSSFGGDSTMMPSHANQVENNLVHVIL